MVIFDIIWKQMDCLFCCSTKLVLSMALLFAVYWWCSLCIYNSIYIHSQNLGAYWLGKSNVCNSLVSPFCISLVFLFCEFNCYKNSRKIPQHFIFYLVISSQYYTISLQNLVNWTLAHASNIQHKCIFLLLCHFRDK